MKSPRTTAVLAATLLLSATLSGCASAKLAATPSATKTSNGGTVARDGEEWILFQGAHDCSLHGTDPSTICLVRPDGSGRHKVLKQDDEVLHPDWSPDGSHIAFSVGGQTIWTAAADGTGMKKVADCTPFASCNGLDYPAWSPDGKTMAFTVYDGAPLALGPPSKSAIALVDLTTGTETTIAQTDPEQLVDQARWSHDGTRLAVQVEQFDSKGDEIGGAIGIVPATGGAPTTITDFTRYATYPDWNPSSDRIVFTTNDYNPAGGSIGLYLINADGTDLAPLSYTGSTAEESKQPSWTPDGQHVIFVQWQSRNVTTVNPDGSGLTTLGDLGTHPRFRPLP